MKKEKINNKDFIRAISRKTGFTQKDITDVLEAVSEITLENLNNGVETAILRGLIVYPATYKGEVTFPRARFGNYFKNLDSVL